MRSGRGDETSYRVATPEELVDIGSAQASESSESIAALVWLQVFREGPIERTVLSQLIPLEDALIDEALATLTKDGRIRGEIRAGGTFYSAEECLIPLGESAGWEAAVLDHHRTVLNAIAAKIASGSRSSAKQDEVGGTTLSFDLWPGHPYEPTVRKLLETTRSEVIPLWEEVERYNKVKQVKGAYQVHYYCGQYVLEEEDLT
jgi:hypothetical protein